MFYNTWIFISFSKPSIGTTQTIAIGGFLQNVSARLHLIGVYDFVKFFPFKQDKPPFICLKTHNIPIVDATGL